MVWEVLGFLGGASIALAFTPQVWRLYKLKSAREISLLYLMLFIFGGICWLTYGILLKLPSVIVSNAVNLTMTSLMLYAKLKYGR